MIRNTHSFLNYLYIDILHCRLWISKRNITSIESTQMMLILLSGNVVCDPVTPFHSMQSDVVYGNTLSLFWNALKKKSFSNSQGNVKYPYKETFDEIYLIKHYTSEYEDNEKKMRLNICCSREEIRKCHLHTMRVLRKLWVGKKIKEGQIAMKFKTRTMF